MKLSSISLFLASAFGCKAVTATSSGYDALLNEIVNNGDNSPSGGEGQVTLSTLSGFSTLSSLTKRDAEPYFKELDMYSFDNYEKLTKVGAMLKQAQSNEMLGDALFLYNFMDRNGYSQSLGLNETSELASETCKFLSSHGLNSTELLASTASSPDLVNFYDGFDISLCNVNHPTKRDKWCSKSHAASRSACEHLASNLYEHGDFAGNPRSYCLAGCCLSWSKEKYFDAGFAKAKTEECIRYCIPEAGSCKINDSGIDYCVSDRSSGCT